MLKIQNSNIKRILEIYREINLLSEIGSILHWDQNVGMPVKAASNRAVQSTYIQGLLTDKWHESEFRSLIEATDSQSLNIYEAAILRNLRHAAKYYYKVPKKLILENTRITTESFSVWQEAKMNNDFKSFAPSLTKVFALQREIADHIGYEDNPYDALLDLYEIGLTTEECNKLFSQIRSGMIVLNKKIFESKKYKNTFKLSSNKKVYSQLKQLKINELLLKLMGYSKKEGRLDISSHPFTTTLGRHDVRITTRYSEDDLKNSLYSTIHEAGHALYELGVDETYAGTPLTGGVSLGVHESQSRFWENMVGKNPDFLKFLYPLVKAEFKNVFNTISFDDFVTYINHVKPGNIRTESDEVSYNLHIILRFEIEQDVLNGRIMVDDLPSAWREKMKSYLDIEPPTDREGVLQDVHWSYGSIGYFPTYTIGNLYSAQILHVMQKDLPFDSLLQKGELTPIRLWLNEHIHRHGSLYLPKDLMMKETGMELSGAQFVDYLSKKYSSIYSL